MSHRVSIAKKVAARLRMSRSSRSTLFSRRNRRSSSRSSVVNPSRSPASTAACPTQRRTAVLAQVELAADRRQRPLAPPHQGNDLSLELRRERPALSPACPVPLRLLPHLDSLHVGSRPHLECPPVGG